jgi:osmoprotectant transport system permease protein
VTAAPEVTASPSRPAARSPWRVALISALWLGGLLLLFSQSAIWETVLRPIFPLEDRLLYPEQSLLTLALTHLGLVIASSLLSVILGLTVAVFVTREVGREFLPLALSLSSLAQVFPPVAVLAVAYPILGFGFAPSLLALALYGFLPVISGAIAGIGSVPADALEASRGMGMTPLQTLRLVELPLASRAILGGVRTSVVVNIGTATIAAAIGAGGLGLPIFAGLENQNFAYVLSGALAVAGLALWADWTLSKVEGLVSGANVE